MKKILIISYFYPPCNLTASQRVHSWAKYLHKSGYYPVIITRKWEKHITSFDDCHYSTSNGIEIERNENFEVHYCPYISNLRDRLHTQKKLQPLKKILSLFEIIFQNIWIALCPFKNLLSEAYKVINKEKDISAIIISGNPFIQFKFGYILCKKYKTPWIADYRDAWTTSTINNVNGNIIFSLLNRYLKLFEKRWTKTASYITASSEPIGKSIENLSKIKSMAIYNGFEPEEFLKYKDIKKHEDHFQIAYIGTLYNGQNISIFLEAYKRFVDNIKPKSKLLFPGLDLDENQKKRISLLMDGYEDYYQTSLRIPKSEIFKIEKQSHLLLHVAWKGHSGIIASKIYEYIGSGSKIIIVPGDNNSIDKIVNTSKSGVIFNDIESTFDFLCEEYNSFKGGIAKNYNINNNSFLFSRENQTKKLSQILDEILLN
tara:strand:- start:229 stop:1515 length:1287 start_codon:yes stop_codon:yes gene_type:complete